MPDTIFIAPDDFYPEGRPNGNGGFPNRTPNDLKFAAAIAAKETQLRYAEAARILAQNRAEMGEENCSLSDGDSDRKREAIQRLLCGG